MKRKTVVILLLSAMLLNACGKKKDETAQKKEKIDVTMFEENDKKRSKYKGYTVEEVYINGKRVKIDVQSHGDHYHIIYDGKKYSLSKEKYNELFDANNKIVLEKETIEKSLAEIDENEIISYYKHGDHWHVKTKHGEFITYEDPSKVKNVNTLISNSVRTIGQNELNSVRIVSFYKHGDHWHVKTSDGREYITYVDPSKNGTSSNSNNTKTVEVTEDVKDNKINGEKIVEFYKHGDHWHVKSESGKEYVTHTDPSGKKAIEEIKDKEELKPEVKNDLFDKVFKHDDHFHVWFKGKEYVISAEEYEKAIRENKFSPKEEKENNGETLSKSELLKKAEKMVQEIMKRYGLKREQIKIDLENNVIVYPHGSHYHYDKIDPNKSGGHTHNHNHEIIEPKRNPEIETKKIIGPFLVEHQKWSYRKKEFMNKFKVEGVKNIDNYNFLTYYTDDDELKESLEINGKKSKAIVYLVLYGTDKSELEKIKTPNVIFDSKHMLKGWYGANLEEVLERDIDRKAQIRKANYHSSPKVLGPFTIGDDLSKLDIDKRDYYKMEFYAQGTIMGNGNAGEFELNGKKSRFFYYFIRDDISFEQAKNSGYKIPKPVANSGYEFVGWGLDPEKEFFGSSKFLGLFGTNRNLIASYIPKDENNPYNKDDSNRPHPRGAVFYNPENYTTLVVKAGENGSLDFNGKKVKTVCLVVRKGTTWKELSVNYPIASPDSGYSVDPTYYDLLTKNETIGENKEYTVKFVKKENVGNDEFDDLFGLGSSDEVPFGDEDLLGVDPKNIDENNKTENPTDRDDLEDFLGDNPKNNTQNPKEVEKPKSNENIESEKNKNDINSEKQTIDKETEKPEKIEKEKPKVSQPVEKDKNL